AAEEALKMLQDLGATVVDPIALEAPRELRRDGFEVLLWELKNDMAAYLATRTHGSPRTLADLIVFNTANAESEMAFFGQEIFLQAQEKGDLSEETYIKALETVQRLTREDGIDSAMAQHELDALVSPSSALAWSIDLVHGDARTGGPSAPWYPAIAGYPHITVPMGDVFGLPIGLSFFAGAWQEARLIELAYAFEQATQARRVPAMVPSLNLARS
ncbi:MAG: amidase family protein, partial [Pseudomonadales bacterium]